MQLPRELTVAITETLAVRSGPYTAGGESASAMTLTDLVSELRQQGWKNISHIDGIDLARAGFCILRSNENPNPATRRADWKDCRGRRIGKWTTLVALAA